MDNLPIRDKIQGGRGSNPVDVNQMEQLSPKFLSKRAMDEEVCWIPNQRNKGGKY